MCGLAGFVQFGGCLEDRDHVSALLKKMGDQIAHRGPDEEKLVVSANVGMVFKRLSIIDIKNGSQPFFNDSGSIILMVNGEIYNHKELRNHLKRPYHLKSESDCEIVLHLYQELGAACFGLLNGIFSVALYDKDKQLLYLARDHLGVKPLYYSVSDSCVVFASEAKSIRCHPAYEGSFCWDTALAYQGSLYSFGKNTSLTSFYSNISLVEGGAYIEVNVNTKSVKEVVYWDFHALLRNAPVTDLNHRNQFIERYKLLLEDSVRMQLASDVEIGIFLSGGIDSVVISMLAAKHQPLHTFTVLSQSTLGNGDASAAHYAAGQFNLPNHQVVFDWRQPGISADDWKYLIWLLETPFTNAEQLYKYQLHQYAKHIRPDLKVILLGQGSDEFNGGYCRSWLSEMSDGHTAQNWAAFSGLLAQSEIGEMARAGASRTSRYVFTRYGSLISKEYLSELTSYPSEQDAWHVYLKRNRSMLQMYNLWHEDRTAAGNSLESRVPYLDHRIVEFLASVPPEYHESLFWDKRILRDAFKAELPQRLSEREKVPFFNGVDLRFTERMMHNILSKNGSVLVEEVLDNDKVSQILNKNALWSAFTRTGKDPEYKGMSVILELVNMGLMDVMFQSGNAERCRFSAPVRSEIAIDAWDSEFESIALLLSERSGAVDRNCVLTFSPNTFLMRPAKESISTIRYIVVGTHVKYRLDDKECAEWIRVLDEIDGKRTLLQILMQLDISEANIRKNLEEAFDYNIVEVVH